MSFRRIVGLILVAASVALLVFFIIPEVRNTFEFNGPRHVLYSQPYEGHALLLLLAIAGSVVSFLAGLFMARGGKNR